MASTGIQRGGLAAIFVGGVKITHLTNVTLNLDLGVRDATSKDSVIFMDNLPGLASWSMDGEAWFAEDGTFNYEDLFDSQIARTQVTVLYSSAVTGDIEYSGTAIITNLSRTAALDSDNESYTVSLTGNGALAKATV